MKRKTWVRWLLIFRNTSGGADFVMDSQYPSRRNALWNKKRLKLQPGWQPRRVRITEI